MILSLSFENVIIFRLEFYYIFILNKDYLECNVNLKLIFYVFTFKISIKKSLIKSFKNNF